MVVTSFLMIFILLFFSIFLFHKGRKKLSNILLALYLISQVVGITNALLFQFRDMLLPVYVHLYFVLYPVVFLWLPLFYFFISSLLMTDFIIKSDKAIHIIPFVYTVVYLSFNFYFKPAEVKMDILNSGMLKEIINGLEWILSIQIVGYNLASYREYRKYQRRSAEYYSQINKTNSLWIKGSLYGFLFVSTATILVKYIEPINGCGWIVLSYVLFLFFYSFLFYLAITNPAFIIPVEDKQKYSSSALSKSEGELFLKQLEDYVAANQTFRKQNLTLGNLSAETGISERNISQIINEVRKQNFYDFINNYRVQYAKSLLEDPQNSNRKMLDILYEAGFNSKTSFNTAFKKITGLTPSGYKTNQHRVGGDK